MAEEDADTAPAKKGNTKKLIFMGVAALVLLSAGVGGSLYFTGMLGGGSDATSAEEHVQEAPKEAEKVPIYFAFADPFTVNIETERGLRFLQVNIELMSYQKEAIDAVQSHLPLIKNNLILLLSSQTYGDLVSLDGKETIRKLALDEIQGVLKKYHVEAKVEELYFTNFVMQ